MNKTAFIKELNKRLRYIPGEDRQDAVEYYTELMADMGFDETEDVIPRLGSPKDAAKKILDECTQKHVDEYAQKKTVKGHATVVWLSVLGVLSLPLSLPLAVVILVLAVAIIAVVISVLVSLAAASIALVVSGLISLGALFAVPGFTQKMVVLGTSFIALGLGSLIGYGLFVLIRLIYRKLFCKKAA